MTCRFPRFDIIAKSFGGGISGQAGEDLRAGTTFDARQCAPIKTIRGGFAFSTQAPDEESQIPHSRLAYG